MKLNKVVMPAEAKEIIMYILNRETGFRIPSIGSVKILDKLCRVNAIKVQSNVCKKIDTIELIKQPVQLPPFIMSLCIK